MDKSRINDQQMIERYVLGKMDDNEASDFEAHFLADQECLDELERIETLHRGLVREYQIKPTSQKPIDISPSAANDSRWWRKQIPLWSVAAMLMLTIVPFSLIFQSENAVSNAYYGGVSIVTVDISNLRSKEPTELATWLTKDRTVLSFNLENYVNDGIYSSYRLQIINDINNEQLINVDQLIADSSDAIYVDIGNLLSTVERSHFLLFGVDKSQAEYQLVEGNLNLRK